jgi:hypothetical protein
MVNLYDSIQVACSTAPEGFSPCLWGEPTSESRTSLQVSSVDLYCPKGNPPWLQCQPLWPRNESIKLQSRHIKSFSLSLCDLFYQSHLNFLRRSDHLIYIVELSLSKMYILYVFSWLQRGDRENAEWRPESPSLCPGSLPPPPDAD